MSQVPENIKKRQKQTKSTNISHPRANYRFFVQKTADNSHPVLLEKKKMPRIFWKTRRQDLRWENRTSSVKALKPGALDQSSSWTSWTLFGWFSPASVKSCGGKLRCEDVLSAVCSKLGDLLLKFNHIPLFFCCNHTFIYIDSKMTVS